MRHVRKFVREFFGELVLVALGFGVVWGAFALFGSSWPIEQLDVFDLPGMSIILMVIGLVALMGLAAPVVWWVRKVKKETPSAD
ncbi:hypothetical protein [Nonomuraea sp. NPDC048916]|uniref:hypothetical protein n=1 Tax=Nonomuraea sp. NPDC048916 TaxID=3154232 RepID=UPI0033CAE449